MDFGPADLVNVDFDGENDFAFFCTNTDRFHQVQHSSLLGCLKKRIQIHDKLISIELNPLWQHVKEGPQFSQ